MSQPPPEITCVECGGKAGLVSFLPDDEAIEEGYPVAYACAECNHRHDLVWTDADD